MSEAEAVARTDHTALRAGASTSRQVRAGVVLMLASSASNQTGAGIGAMAFPVIGPVGVVAVRQLVTALILAPIVRPRFRGLHGRDWALTVALAIVFSVMNLCLYLAIERIGLGLAVTLEFLGPLGVAILGTRRLVDRGCAVLAGIGVVVLTDPGSSTDLIGIALALAAAGAWACYILLNRRVGRQLPGLQGTAIASVVTAGIWAPVAVVWFVLHAPTPAALGLAAACGVMSSLVPYVADLLELRRISAQVFGTFTSLNPVWAALAGWLLLHQTLGANEWVGVALIVVSSAIVSMRALAPSEEQGPVRR
ncbi:MAG: EamA family transporter [Microbacteriaceae bacterium]